MEPQTPDVERLDLANILGTETLPIAVFYDPISKVFWVENGRRNWIQVNETGVKRLLTGAEIRAKKAPGETLSPLERVLNHIMCFRDVEYAAPLAGYAKGEVFILGRRILVTESCKTIEPRAGKCETILEILRRMLRDPNATTALEPKQDQLLHFLGWLKHAYEALRAGKIAPGQAVIFAGPHDTGKTLVQDNVITPVLGGRSASPYTYFSGKTTFNSELFAAVHLAISDESPCFDLASRRAFGTALKGVAANSTHYCHRKHREALTLKPFWRVTVSVNDEAENLQILPPLDESLEDKLMLLRAYKHPGGMPMPTVTLEERDAFVQQITDELPAFCQYLLDLEIPGEIRSPRFGVRHYHDPHLLAAIDAMAPETRLLELIDRVLAQPPDHDKKQNPVPHALENPEGLRACQVESLLRLHLPESADSRALDRLLGWNNAIGAYLGRIAKKHPERVEARRTSTDRLWRIRRKQAPEARA